MSKLRSLIIKACTTVVPGFGKMGAPFGQLLKTSELLTRSFSSEQQKTIGKSDFNSHFIGNKLGIKSVACSNSTLAVCDELWTNSEKYTSQTAYALSQSTPNSDLYKALETSIANAITMAKDGVHDAQFKISAHIHIVAFAVADVEDHICSVRRRLGLSLSSPITTIILQQGCSGILTALDLAKLLVSGFPEPEKENVLITSENNMMLSAHQRFPFIERPNGINSWLWGAIFGEGVGAMIVSGSEKNLPLGVSWKIDLLERETIENDWRVKLESQEAGYSTVSIRAREVSDTYMRGVSKHAKIAIDLAGGLDNIFRVCFHESNPMLLEKVSQSVGVNLNIVPTLSAEVGTLACVSSFTLLEKSTQEFKLLASQGKPLLEAKKLVFSIIGEAGGRVDVGHMVLSPVI
ncbi:MAG: hypothetical protein JSS53_06715 [Proteobacteria bacterium]|nr:hypothetical protein [Pseudomonadota bacterium]